jgi:hypothetical protein
VSDERHLNNARFQGQHGVLNMNDERTAAYRGAIAVAGHNAQVLAKLHAGYARRKQAVYVTYAKTSIRQGVFGGLSMQGEGRCVRAYAYPVRFRNTDYGNATSQIASSD